MSGETTKKKTNQSGVTAKKKAAKDGKDGVAAKKKAAENSKTQKKEPECHPILPLNNVVGLPGDTIGFTLQSSPLVQTVKAAFEQGLAIFTTPRKEINLNQSGTLFGSLALVGDLKVLENHKVRFRLKFQKRCEMYDIKRNGDILEGKAHTPKLSARLKKEEKVAIEQEFKALLQDIQAFTGIDNLLDEKIDFHEFDLFIAKVARVLDFPFEDRILFLEGWSLKKQIHLLSEKLEKSLEVHRLRKQIRDKAAEKMNRIEKHSLLQEERKVIELELKKSGHETPPPEFQDLKERIDSFNGPERVKEVMMRDFNKILRAGPFSPHTATIQDYLETLLDLPWGVRQAINPSWQGVEESLNDSHFGLEKVKERILRYLAINHLTPKRPGSILCLVGPPGTGKTSFAKAIAEALELPFIKKSLGGVHDESEIRGHRRTYIGALPGRIIQGLRKAGCANPVFLLDEIDKLGHDHRGNPADALLEVLDPEDNAHFSDHYIELEFDLSGVFWVLTANTEAAIPAPLRDRMEIIHFSGYTEDEKMHIAQEYLLERNMKINQLDDYKLKLSESVCRRIIRQYTREAGVRELDRKISNLIQHKALSYIRNKGRKSWSIQVKDLLTVFGPAEIKKPIWKRSSWEAGVIAGLAWTASGGTVLRLECSTYQGKGALKLTGKLGEVMKESAHTALSFIRKHHTRLGLEEDILSKQDMHIHIPAGAVSKEGPSAGLGLALLIYSALTKRKSLAFWALTGEISLHGKVLPIGGVKEKILAAQQEGFKGVLLPKLNQGEVEEIKPEELGQLEIKYAADFWEAFNHFFP
ncbi:MAG: endopeptidase La [Planctomycetes bacterium]|nr:endopeptidase La [Planctomycetota bacterium]